MAKFQNFIILLLCAIGVIIGSALPLVLVFFILKLSHGQGHLVLGQPLLIFFCFFMFLSIVGNVLMYIRKKRYYSHKKKKSKRLYEEV